MELGTHTYTFNMRSAPWEYNGNTYFAIYNGRDRLFIAICTLRRVEKRQKYGFLCVFTVFTGLKTGKCGILQILHFWHVKQRKL